MKYILFVLFFPLIIYGQFNSNTLLPQIMPSNPKAFEFMKYGEIPVGKYTGVPSIAIPIYTIQAKGLDIPVNLSYHSNGFRVSEEAGWTGLGWTLQGGGNITQVVNGTDDFGRYRNRTIPNFNQIMPNAPELAFAGCSGFYFDATGNESTAGGLAGFLKIPRYYVNGNWDVQPDIFKFNVLGYSGTFILDWKNEKFVCLSDSNINIESPNYIVSNGSPVPVDFIITVPDGHRFFFNIKEEGKYVVSGSSSLYYGGSFGQELKYDEEKAFRTYQLIEIRTNQEDVITYNYDITNELTGYPSVSSQRTDFIGDIFTTIPFGFNTGDVTESVIVTKQRQSYLSSIVFNGGLINFTASARNDIEGAKKLDQVEISNQNGTKVKKIVFDYDYFRGHSNGTNLDNYLQYGAPWVIINKTANELSTRLKLKSITENGNPPHIFEYNESISLPKKTSLASDYWGYYNGFMTNVSVFPDFYAFNAFRDKTFLKLYAGNCKSSDLESTKAGVLNKIIYPTGGSTQFTYELNSFDNYIAPPKTQGQLKIIDITTIPYPYNTTKSTSEAVLIEGGNTIFTGSAKLYTGGCYPQYFNAHSNCYVRLIHFKKEFIPIVKAVSGYSTYGLKYALAMIQNSNPTLYNQNIDSDSRVLFKVANGIQDENFSNLEYNLEEGIAYFMVSGGCGTFTYGSTSNPISNTSQASLYLTYRDYKPLIGKSFGGGLRIKSILNFSGANVLTHQKEYEYDRGKLMTPLVFVNKSRYTHEKLISVAIDGCQSQRFDGDKYTFSSSSVTTLSTNASGSYVGYDMVTEKSIANNYSSTVIPTNGKIISYFSNNPDNVGYNLGNSLGSDLYSIYPFNQPPIINPLDNGLTIKEQYFTSENILLKEIINDYKPVVSNNCFTGLRSAVNKVLLVDGVQCMFDTDAVNTIGVYKVAIQEKSQLLNGVETSYFNGTANFIGFPLKTSKEFSYDSHKQLNYSKEVKSNQDIFETRYKYPYDYPYEYSGLVYRNMISPIIKTNKYMNQNLISVEKSLYKYMPSTTVNNVYFESKYVIDKIQFAKSGNDNDLEDKVIFHNYDKYANPTEVSQKDGTRISYIWGYNHTQPIAKIENATYASITASLITTAQAASDTGTEASLLTALSALRTALPNAMVTTYTYKPLVGVSTITDPKGDTITYTYDSFGRLQFVKDKEGNLLSKNEYHYKE